MERASLLDVRTASYFHTNLINVNGQPLAKVVIPSPLHRRGNRLLKRAIDLLLSAIVLVAVFPWFLPLVAILIRVDSRGPVFFRQKRHKQNGKVFTCFKLRTMIVNDEADLRAAFAGDGRITRIGALLRRTHLDELPQLLNVLLGDMSLVGPRPHMLSENAQFDAALEGYGLRHQVKPGITGLAQVRGHVGATHDKDALRERLHSDLQYIRNWSPALDSRILWNTVTIFLRNKKHCA